MIKSITFAILFACAALVPPVSACDFAKEKEELTKIFFTRAPVSEIEGQKILDRLNTDGKKADALEKAGRNDEACEILEDMIDWMSAYPAK